MLGGVIELRHGAGHGPGHARTDDQGDQFNDREEDEDSEQNVLDTSDKIPQRREQMSVKHRRASPHLHQSPDPRSFSGFPVQHRQRRWKRDLTVHAVDCSRHCAHGKGLTQMHRSATSLVDQNSVLVISGIRGIALCSGISRSGVVFLRKIRNKNRDLAHVRGDLPH